MESIVKNLNLPEGQIPPYVVSGLQYEVITGSQAYGTAGPSSDVDVYGFCIPPNTVVFPHLAGEIDGFGTRAPRFDQFLLSAHPLPEINNTCDLQIFSIVKFFNLCMDNNPNMLDVLYVPEDCILHMTDIGRLVRDNRKSFLHKGLYHKFKGYAWAQMKKIESKKPVGKRVELVEKFGYDTKFAGHLVRLYLETEQLVNEQNMDLRKDSQILRDVREGKWSLQEVREFAMHMEKKLEADFAKTALHDEPNEERLKFLLNLCLWLFYSKQS